MLQLRDAQSKWVGLCKQVLALLVTHPVVMERAALQAYSAFPMRTTRSMPAAQQVSHPNSSPSNAQNILICD
jgi:hypothetical protein